MRVLRGNAPKPLPMRYQRAELPLKLDGLEAARIFFTGCMAEQDPSRETLWVAHVDAQARCLHLGCHASDRAGERIPVGEIIADAMAHQSAGIVLAHNHKGADVGTGIADWPETRQLAELASSLDCTVIDHLVFADAHCSSLRRLGRL